MFKWPTPPSAYAPKHELADFAELTCWQDTCTSATSLLRLLGRLGENDYSQGVPEEDDTDRFVEDAYDEIERRQEACGDDYPFVLGRRGSTLQIKGNGENNNHIVYKYLLLATRLNMNDNRLHAGVDGTRLLEKLAAEVAKEYFGPRAESLVFGAGANNANFAVKVNDLCNRLKEGGGFKSSDEGDTAVKDGKLDVVAWTPFTDGLPGKLIGFGQCKTGTHYRDSLTQLRPDAFCSKWLYSNPAVIPMRMFFIAEALTLSKGNRRNMSIDAGLLFDRCRIVDFCDEVDIGVMDEVRQWTAGAAKANALPLRDSFAD